MVLAGNLNYFPFIKSLPQPYALQVGTTLARVYAISDLGYKLLMGNDPQRATRDTREVNSETFRGNRAASMHVWGQPKH